MRLRHLLAVAACAALVPLALPASAVIKIYDATPPHGTAGDNFAFAVTLCPTIRPQPGQQQGDFTLSDTGSGTITIADWNQQRIVLTDIPPAQLSAVFGPGSYVFVDSRNTMQPTIGLTAPGSTAPGGTVDWGVLGGWTATGLAFCIASPQTICTAGAQIPHGQTVPVPPVNSPTYDLGTWVFDSEGDFEAASTYIWGTFNGGVSNQQSLLRGVFVGGGIPALPLLGLGALAVSLVAVGARATLRRR